jgi:AraC-like DNA-binding protein
MFLTTDKSVTEISEACGYSSVSYFIMSFKKKNGITPGAYKLKMKALGKDMKK